MKSEDRSQSVLRPPSSVFRLRSQKTEDRRRKTVRPPSSVLCLFFLAWIFFPTVGCQTPTKQSSAGKIILPTDIAGTWKAQDSPWKIVISGDGTVSSAIIPMGEVEIKPNQTTNVEMKDGSLGTFKAGDCVVEYVPQTRELFVSVEMEQIHIKFLDNVIDGNSIDRFVGPVSQDGKFWMADWITIFDYGPRFPQEPNDIVAKPLVFEKIK